jgi:hypothetical protein
MLDANPLAHAVLLTVLAGFALQFSGRLSLDLTPALALIVATLAVLGGLG